MKTLFLSEKPSVGREIAGVLGKEWQNGDGYMENDDYIITWATGHLLGLAGPELYHPRFKRWLMQDLPIVPRRFQLAPIRGKGKQLAQLKKLLNRKDVEFIVNACDAGREGELIFAWITQYCEATKPVKRLWLSSLTTKAITEALDNLRPGEDMAALELSARARASADWLVGINATRGASIRFRPIFDSASSLGRVQTPTLAIIVNRQHEIDQFQSEPRWGIEGEFQDQNGIKYKGKWYCLVDVEEGKAEKPEDKEEDDNENDLVDAQDISADEEAPVPGVKKQKEQEFVSSEGLAKKIMAAVLASPPDSRLLWEINDQDKNEPAPLLYDLTSLQREANKKWKWSAKKTLQIVQELYERHKAITYPRTDSRYLGSDQIQELPNILTVLASYEGYGDIITPLLTGTPTVTHPDRVFDDTKVSDHHAILPTTEPDFAAFWSEDTTDPKTALPEDHYKIYDLIVKRMLCHFYPDATFRTLSARTQADDPNKPENKHKFVTKGKGLIIAGWREVYGQKVQPDKVPNLTKGKVELLDCKITQSESKPPKPYTEGTLLQAMETAGRKIKDEKLKEAMKEKGLGTPATRAATIERLISVEYVKRQRGELIPTDKGMRLIEYLGNGRLTSAELTGEWEQRLREIEDGADVATFWKDIVIFTRDTIQEIQQIKLPQAKPAQAPIAQQSSAKI